MGKAKKVAIFGLSVMGVLLAAPIVLALADKLTGGAVGNAIASSQRSVAGALGVSTGVTEIAGRNISD
jgi:hypothetical protein